MEELFWKFWENFRHNLFKPLLLFFYMGFSVPILKVPFEFPHVLYQGLTMYLLIAIGWKGGEELAELNRGELAHAAGFMVVGFITNFMIGIIAYLVLRSTTRLRKIDAATVAGYYGSDSAGTFVTCQGILATAGIASAPYMPVMLAIMEVPGCLVALFLVSRLRRSGMDSHGNLPGEAGYDPRSLPAVDEGEGHNHRNRATKNGNGSFARFINWELMHEVFLNPGLFLLFGGIFIGFVSQLQGAAVTKEDDALFRNLFQGALCLFLLEMGMTACKRLKDLRTAGLRFVLFALIGPNIFATCGIFVAHAYSAAVGQPFALGTYVLFAVLCAAASYIAVPAIQRLAIPEASPTLPLAASLGVTFSYNVTVGIPIYILIAEAVIKRWEIVGAAAGVG
ncbi:MAG TPA: sodium-dependent bicarbonate transport family permease [Pirellulales bacterium]|nr:sodium-dependent bicarbonate transport family permease [Pirellulales bacterium]